MASLVTFKFSSEELRGEPRVTPSHEGAATGGMLDSGMWGSRTRNATEARQHGINWVPDLKYSVINAFADTWACFCCGRWSRFGCTRPATCFGLTLYRASLTRAQWLWAINFVCLVVHSVFAWLSFNSCNATRFGQRVNENCTATGMSIPVNRFVINWTDTAANGYNVALVDNGMPVRIDYLTGWFFLLSAIFHAIAVLVGPFDRFAPFYWKQLDNALSYWRWIEYSASASVMVLALFLVSGIREQNNLAMAFFLMFSTQGFGLLTEMYSRPDKRESDGYRGWCGDPVRTDALLTIERKKRAFRDRNNVQREEHPRQYPYDQTMAMQSTKTRYEWENQPLSDMPPPMTYEEQEEVYSYAMAYTLNYVRRMVPHVLGFFPYITVWVIFLNGFFTQLTDLQQGDADLFSQVPDWVPVAIIGTVIIFSSFTLVQIRYQWLSPDEYWKTEMWYCFLSLTAKVFLGGLLLVNVLAFASVQEALADTAAARAMIPPPSSPPPMTG